MDLHRRHVAVLVPRQDERHARRRRSLVQAAELRRRREPFLDEVVEWVVVDMHDLDGLTAVQRVLPLVQHLAGAQVGVDDDLAAHATDRAVRPRCEADHAEARSAHEVDDLLHRLDGVHIPLEPEVLLLAVVEVALDARVGELVALAGREVEVRPLEAGTRAVLGGQQRCGGGGRGGRAEAHRREAGAAERERTAGVGEEIAALGPREVIGTGHVHPRASWKAVVAGG